MGIRERKREKQSELFYIPNLQTNQRASYSKYSKSGQAIKIKAKRTESKQKNQEKNENFREEVKIQRMSNGLPRLLSRYERIYLRYQGPAICNALNTKAAGPPSVPHRLQPGQGPGPGDARPPVHQVHLRGQEAPDLGENISNSADYSRWRHQRDSSRASKCCGESLSSL